MTRSAGPGPVKPPPPSKESKRALLEAHQRSRAVPVYRALVRAHEHQPPHELTWAELRDVSGLFTIEEVIEAVGWMRGKGVLIGVAPGREPGDHAVIALIQRLPEAFEESLGT